MAKAAIFAKRAAMLVIFQVTSRAFGRRIGERFACVAGRALNAFVFSQEGKSGKVMIEGRAFSPRDFIVTGSAILSLRALVRIVAAMTIDARLTRQARRHGVRMASFA